MLLSAQQQQQQQQQQKRTTFFVIFNFMRRGHTWWTISYGMLASVATLHLGENGHSKRLHSTISAQQCSPFPLPPWDHWVWNHHNLFILSSLFWHPIRTHPPDPTQPVTQSWVFGCAANWLYCWEWISYWHAVAPIRVLKEIVTITDSQLAGFFERQKNVHQMLAADNVINTYNYRLLAEKLGSQFSLCYFSKMPQVRTMRDKSDYV